MIPILDRIFARIDQKLSKALHQEWQPIPGENEIVGAYVKQGYQYHDKMRHAVACVEADERRLNRLYPNRPQWVDEHKCLSRIFEVSQRREQGIEPFAAEIEKVHEAHHHQSKKQRALPLNEASTYWDIPLGWPS